MRRLDIWKNSCRLWSLIFIPQTPAGNKIRFTKYIFIKIGAFFSWSLKIRELLRKLSYYFVQRIFNERHRKKSWDKRVPEEYKLTDDDIARFVSIMKPCVEQAMFSRQGLQDVRLALQYLASLRPDIIVPVALEKLYASVDSLTEPHRLTSSMMAVLSVARYLFVLL